MRISIFTVARAVYHLGKISANLKLLATLQAERLDLERQRFLRDFPIHVPIRKTDIGIADTDTLNKAYLRDRFPEDDPEDHMRS